MDLIRLNDVSFGYGEGGMYRPVLSHLSQTVEAGSFVGIIGPSGCGKTTLLRLLSGLALPGSGSLIVGGEPLTGPCEQAAVVFQEYTLFPWMTVRRYVAFCLRETGRAGSRKTADRDALDYLAYVGMTDAADLFPSQLSGGMRQRAALAGALALDRRILLLDEPFGALDRHRRQELQKLLRAIQAAGSVRKTIIMVTHDIDEALALSDRIWLMGEGGVRADVTVPEEPEHRRKLREALIMGLAASDSAFAYAGGGEL